MTGRWRAFLESRQEVGMVEMVERTGKDRADLSDGVELGRKDRPDSGA